MSQDANSNDKQFINEEAHEVENSRPRSHHRRSRKPLHANDAVMRKSDEQLEAKKEEINENEEIPLDDPAMKKFMEVVKFIEAKRDILGENPSREDLVNLIREHKLSKKRNSSNLRQERLEKIKSELSHVDKTRNKSNLPPLRHSKLEEYETETLKRIIPINSNKVGIVNDEMNVKKLDFRPDIERKVMKMFILFGVFMGVLLVVSMVISVVASIYIGCN